MSVRAIMQYICKRSCDKGKEQLIEEGESVLRAEQIMEECLQQCQNGSGAELHRCKKPTCDSYRTHLRYLNSDDQVNMWAFRG